MPTGSQSVSNFNALFIERTRLARKRSGKSQETIAAELGISQPTYAKYETRSPMPHHLVMSFCALCEVTPAWLYTAAIPVAEAKPRRQRSQKVA